jgi:putative tricarboxylic transport membrane protein
MDWIHHIVYGFQVTFIPMNLLFCAVGVIVGTLVGVLPGIGPTAAMALLLPVTYKVTPASSIIMLCGILYGSQYGGSTTSILVNIPGEASSIVTCLDGYQMARKGRAGPALGIAAWGSFVAGTISVIALMVVANPLAKLALSFGPPEYFALMCTGLIFVTYLAQGSVMKAIMMALTGIILGSIGLDLVTGQPKFTLGIPQLEDGVGVMPVIMGLFGLSEVFQNIESKQVSRIIYETKVKNLWPSLKDWADSKWAIVRGTLVGFFLGILPGGGGTLASFLSYGIEKRISNHPQKFGTGVIEGVAAPESANNASCGGGLIPLLSLGIPPNVTMAVLFSAFVIHGITPGPLLITEHADIFWGLIASMYLGNVLLLVLNLPLIGVWVQLLKVPYGILFPLILLFCVIGSYSTGGSTTDIILMLFFGVGGYLMRKFKYEAAALILGYVLGPMIERSLRQSLLISDGSFTIFVTRPISAVTLGIALLLLLSSIFGFTRKSRMAYNKFKE